jgi:3-oxoacyl-[acyl-carrier-protein] synthase-1
MFDALVQRRGNLRRCEFEPFGAQYRVVHRLDTWIGEVAGVDEVSLPPHLARYDCRNNRLAYLALQQDGMLEQAERLRTKYGGARVAVILGTSTSGLLQSEWAYYRRFQEQGGTGNLPREFEYSSTLNCYSAVSFVCALTGLSGPSYTISTACSSSAKVFAAAGRLLRAGLVDAALVGGVDSLCLTTLYGFGSLELLSPAPCKPYAPDRSGINIGEGAGYATLELASQAPHAEAVLEGWGESNDAHHMSTPHPEGLGAELAMRAALERARLQPADIGYINLHGTASRSNDLSEGTAVGRLFGGVPTSSTKGWFGHLLGAAGITETAVTLLALTHDYAPGTLNTEQKDPACGNRLLLDNAELPLQHVLTNSFGFGGSNCSLIFGKPPDRRLARTPDLPSAAAELGGTRSSLAQDAGDGRPRPERHGGAR